MFSPIAMIFTLLLSPFLSFAMDAKVSCSTVHLETYATPADQVFLKRLHISEAEFLRWRRDPTARVLLERIREVSEVLENAPIEGFDLLALTYRIDGTYFPPIYDVLRGLRHDRFFEETEILLNRDFDQLKHPLTAIYLAEKLATPEILKWFHSWSRSPGRVLLMARLLQSLPPPSFDPQYRNYRKNTPYLRHITMRLRQMLGEKGLRPYFKSSRSFTQNFLTAAYMHFSKPEFITRALHAVRERIKPGDHVGSLIRKEIFDTVEHENMLEWATEKLHRDDSTVDTHVPERWQKFLRFALEARKLGLSSGRGRDAISRTEHLLLETFRNYYEDLLFHAKKRSPEMAQIIYKGGEGLAHPEKEFGMLPLFAVAFGMSGRFFEGEAASSLVLSVLSMNGYRLKSGTDLKRELPGFLAAEILPSLRELFPEKSVAATAPETIEIPKQTFDEKLLSEALDTELPPIVPEIPSFDLAQLPKIDMQKGNASLSAETSMSSVKADVVYNIEFRRPHHKFSGAQAVLFKKSALDAILDYSTKEVQQQTWLAALEMGIAAPHGQRGIKILEASHDQLLFELKLLLTPWRIIGHWKDGVWVLEHMEDPH